jgi:signal transduction histidine kinase
MKQPKRTSPRGKNNTKSGTPFASEKAQNKKRTGNQNFEPGSGSHSTLDQITHDLRERIKELTCLYTISSIVEKPDISVEEILQQTVDILPLAWQYPEITCARIQLVHQSFATENLRETPWQQSQPILVKGAVAGHLQIFYLEERAEGEEGPFLREERSLIKVIAERIGGIIQRKQGEAALRESEAHNKALLEAIPDFMFQIDREGTLIWFHEGKFTETRSFLANFVGRNVHTLADDMHLIPPRLIEQLMTYVTRAFTVERPQVFEQHVALESITADFEVRLVVCGPNEVLAIVRDITARKRLEWEILEISGREQRRIGQDLHDSLCQHLAGVGFMAKVFERQLAAGLPVEAERATEIVQLIDEAITLTRGFARGLNPVALDTEGLMVALSGLAAYAQKFFGVTCRFEHNAPLLVEDNVVATHLYRIAQEAINNAVKHGKADTITIAFNYDGKVNTLSITDNGVGITTHRQGKGLGISIMNYRASMIGATLKIMGAPGQGALVACSFPSRRGAG